MPTFSAKAATVQQEREIEKLRVLEFPEQLGVALIPLRLRLLQAMQTLDREKGMFVHRKAVIKVADHQRVN